MPARLWRVIQMELIGVEVGGDKEVAKRILI